jgi:hypothetical protein
MSKRSGQAWCGIDAGKGHHWAAVVDEAGATLWSKKIDNDETAILTALGEILDLADKVRWAVDISGTASALLPAMLATHGQQAVYVPKPGLMPATLASSPKRPATARTSQPSRYPPSWPPTSRC